MKLESISQVNDPLSSARTGKKPPVDLTALQSITGDDYDLEKELLRLFLSEMHKNLEVMRKAENDYKNSLWMEMAHKIKGSSANVGAEQLREFSAAAQLMPKTASVEQRRAMFNNILSAFTSVEDYLMLYLEME